MFDIQEIKEVYDRFANLKDVMYDRNIDQIRANFTYYDVKKIMYILGELIAIRENK